jgi:dipeptidyl-peptidase-4
MSTKAEGLTFDRVFASPSLDGPQPRNSKISPDGRYLTLLRNRDEDRERYDLWAFDRSEGGWRMLIDSLQLGSGRELSEAEKMQRERQRVGNFKGIISYDWRDDGSAILVPLDGDLYLAGVDGSVRRLTNSPQDALNAVLSPNGGFVSFVRESRLWVGALDGTEPKPITPQETEDTVHWGEAEFVAQEEMDRMTGFWWSSDDARIAVERYDEALVDVVTRAVIGAEEMRTYEQRYPTAGTANVLVSLYVMKPDGSDRVQVDLGPDPDIYLARVNWARDGKTLYVQRENREQTQLDMLVVDPATGSSLVLFTETASPNSWINITDNYRFLKDGSLVWWSERDGQGHLYHFKDDKWSQLTSGAWMVTKLVSVDEAKSRILFVGNRDDVLAEQLYAIDISKPGTPERLTEMGWSNAATGSRDGSTVVITRASTSHPSQTYIANDAGERLAWVEENRLDAEHPYSTYLASHRPTTFGTIKADDGSELYWMMITPPLEPGRRAPVFFQHYGGPGVQSVKHDWRGNVLAQAIVDKGYIYFEIDNRGSANRGVAYESQIRQAMGTVEVADQRAGAKYLKTLDFVDPDKIAIYGWSYGGYMTLKMLEADPGLYAVGISGAPVTKWELYDTHYTERYMGDPRKVSEAYRKSNTLEDSGKIVDPLLLIHGMSDDNVVFKNSTTLMAKLQSEATPFEMMLYPGQTHRVGGPKISVHLWNTIFTFLERHGVTPSK